MLTLPEHIFAEIVCHCEEGYPHEVCGLLLGKKGSDQSVIVHESMRAKNVNTTRAADRYELDPQDFFHAEIKARENKREVIGFYHSHPDHPAVASQTDAEQAFEGYVYLIIAIEKKLLKDYRAWRLDGDRMVEVPLEVSDGKSENPHTASKLHTR